MQGRALLITSFDDPKRTGDIAREMVTILRGFLWSQATDKISEAIYTGGPGEPRGDAPWAVRGERLPVRTVGMIKDWPDIVILPEQGGTFHQVDRLKREPGQQTDADGLTRYHADEWGTVTEVWRQSYANHLAVLIDIAGKRG